jgi:nitrogen fixation NifU-like protein
MEDLYLEHILDHYQHPRNKTVLSNEQQVCSMQNHGCGDEVRVLVQLSPEGNVDNIAWDGRGCAISQASASILSSRLVGLTSGEIQSWSKEEVEAELGVELSVAREKCGLLFIRAVQKAVAA